jgi:hypothetical protein
MWALPLAGESPRHANLQGERMGNTYSKLAPWALLDPPKGSTTKTSDLRDTSSTFVEDAVSGNVFESMLNLERQRAERSRKPFVLMLLDAHLENGAAAPILRQAVDVILATKRETDLVGWYKEDAIVGVIFTEVNLNLKQSIPETLHSKIETAIVKHLGPTNAAKIFFSLHVFPENWEQDAPAQETADSLYADFDSVT